MKDRIKRLDSLINSILEFARIGSTSAPIETVDIQLLLTQIIESLSPPPRVHVIFDRNIPNIRAHKILLIQIFQNLISNAIKFNPKDPANIHIGFEQIESGELQFYVADNGLGIEPNFHQRIFEIFQKLESKDKIAGNGIGLAIVKKIVSSQGGRVWVNSTVNEGATFYFTWRTDVS